MWQVSLEEILANTETKAPEAKRPAEWTPGVQQTGDSAYCVTTPFPAHEDPDESELVTSIGFNPEQWAISGDINAGTWQKANGEWLKSFKFQVTRSLARDRHDIESLLKIVERRKPRPEGFVTNTNPAMVVSLNDWQVGKLLTDSTPIFTPSGWTTHGALQPGDYVYGPNGNPVKVTAVSGSYDIEIYNVVFDRGVVLQAAGPHLWEGWRKFKKGKSGPYTRRRVTMSTEDIGRLKPSISRGRSYQSRPFHVDLPAPIQMPEQDLPIDPYLLGVWLGDGASASGCWTTAKVDQQHWMKAFEKCYVCHEQKNQVDLRIPGLTTILRENKLLKNKHVPSQYLSGSAHQRLALLQGLMDTDGYVGPRGNCEFSNTNREIIDSVLHLITSLGMKYTIFEKEPSRKTHSLAWRVQFTPNRDNEFQRVFRMKRKLNLLRSRTEDETQYRYVQSVESAGVARGQCISVEGNLYLAGKDLVVTHNSKEPEGGTPEMIDRLLISFAAVRARLRELTRLKRRPSMIVLANTGDLVEAVSGHYPSQPFIVDLNGREQLRVARRLLFRMVDELVSDGYRVLVTAVPCNHGENRNASGKAQTTPDDNASLTIVEGIEEACMANPDRYEGVSFAYAKDLTMVIDVSGVNLGLTHGHQIKGAGSGAASVEKWWQGQIMGCQPIASADILLTAHRHHFQISEETGRTVMLAPAMDGGSYWFTSTTGRSAPRGMLMVSIGDTYDRGWAELCIM